MFCPNCGNKNSSQQKFCRSCGLGLEKIANSLAEQLPTKATQNLEAQKEKLERLGVAALSVFGIGLLSFILYAAFQKLMVSNNKLVAGFVIFSLLIMVACGLLSVFLFAKAKDLKAIPLNDRVGDRKNLSGAAPTGKLLEEASAHQGFSVTDRTTDLLEIKKKSVP